METMEKTVDADVEDTGHITEDMAIIGTTWVTVFP
jgi:hypothetical protein